MPLNQLYLGLITKVEYDDTNIYKRKGLMIQMTQIWPKFLCFGFVYAAFSTALLWQIREKHDYRVFEYMRVSSISRLQDLAFE